MQNAALDAASIKEVERLVTKGLEVRSVSDHAPAVVLVPSGVTTLDLEQYLERPRRVKTEPVMILADSFTDYLNKYAIHDVSIVKGSLSQGVFEGVIDYHKNDISGESGGNGNADVVPSWCTHKPKLKLKIHSDFQKLLDSNDEWMDQLEFVEVLEDLSHCVNRPDEATIKEAVMGFQARRNVTFQSNPNRANGNMIFEYKDETQTVGKVSIPETIVFACAPYEASKPQLLTAQLRFRINSGELKFKYVIQQLDKVRRDAFDQVAADIREKTGLPVYITE